MTSRTRLDVRQYMAKRIKKLVDEANVRGMDGVATLLNTTMQAIEAGGSDLIEFAVWSKNSWQSIRTRDQMPIIGPLHSQTTVSLPTVFGPIGQGHFVPAGRLTAPDQE